MKEMKEYPFSILDITDLLQLKVRRRQPTNMDVDCPFCGHKKGKMNINLEKNVFRCNYCNESGGMIELYAKVFKISNAQAYGEVCELLCCGKNAENIPQAVEKPYIPDMEQLPRADLETRHQTYSIMLSQLILSPIHQKNLMDRGLTAEQIVRYGYKSTPVIGMDKIISTIMAKECVIDGVPGFYTKKDNTYGIQFSKFSSGILIPVRSMDGRIEGFQIRLDHPKDDRKYIWFSSSNQFRGASIGGPVHFIGDPADETVYVTEGALKANVAHSLSRKTFVALAGVSHYKALEPVFSQLKENGTKQIIEAYDMDKYTNPHVERACMEMIKIANSFGFQVHRLRWNERYKGIDDWLANKSLK